MASWIYRARLFGYTYCHKHFSLILRLPVVNTRILKFILATTFVLLIAACGGGSGGGDNVDGIGSIVIDDAQSSPTPAPSDDSDDVSPPEATIIFPPAISQTEADSVTVRGTAFDENGVSSVSVNGVVATTSDSFATWQATVVLAPGENVLLVAIQDNLQNIDLAAAMVNIVKQPLLVLPRIVAADSRNNRALLVNEFTVPASTNLNTSVLAVDLTSGGLSELLGFELTFPDPKMDIDYEDSVYDENNNRLLTLASNNNSDGASVIVTELDEGVISSISLDQNIRPQHILYDPISDSVIISDTSCTLSVLNENTGELTLLFDFERQTIRDLSIDVANNRLFLILSNFDVSVGRSIFSVVSLDLANGVLNIISDENTPNNDVAFDFPTRLVVDDEADQILVYDRNQEALIAVDVETGVRTILADNDGVGSGPSFIDITEIKLDSTNNRLLVSDASLGAILAVELASGNRSVLVSNVLSINPVADISSALASDFVDDRVFFHSGALEDIAVLNLLDRVNSSLFAAEPIPVIRDMVFDERGNRVIGIGLDSLVFINLDGSGQTELPASNFIRLALDAAGERIFLLNSSTFTVSVLDLSTNEISVAADLSDLFQSADVLGNIFVNLQFDDLTVDAENNRIFILDDLQDDSDGESPFSANPRVIEVSLSTGARTFYENIGIQDFISIDFDSQNNRIILVSKDETTAQFLRDFDLTGTLVGDLNLDTGVSTVLSRSSEIFVDVDGVETQFLLFNPLLSPENLALDSDRQIAHVLDRSYDAVFVVDLISGKKVVLPR